MCGICGKLCIDGAPIDPQPIERMCQALAHRGPDDQGVFFSPRVAADKPGLSVALGHRRLSIIDLSADGRQPMTNEDGAIQVVFNGEIYNYRQLRQRLETERHAFRSRSDTEVLLHLYEEHGIDAVHHLNGMFAFALWDAAIARLWLCRDRVGIKPLVYHWDGTTLCFASEIKALLQDPAVPRQIDGQALALYLAFNYIPAPWTIYRGIYKLPPAHHLVLEKGALRIERYWCPPPTADPGRAAWSLDRQAQRVCAELPALLQDVVAEQMVSDVPLGAFLSGGVDSSIVVALMARCSPRPVKTFSIGFKDLPLFDETRYARMVARRWKTDHQEFQLTSSVMRAVLDEVLDGFDEPFADSSAIPTFVVSRQTRRQVAVALSGDGGDELFAGYRSYHALFWRRFYLMAPALLRRALVENLIEWFPDARDNRLGEYVRRAKKFTRSMRGDFLQCILALKEVFDPALRRRVMADPRMAPDRDPVRDHVEASLEAFAGDPINRLLYADVTDSLPGDMLTKVDWMSMRHGLEVRVPLLDHRVVELAFGIPGALKLRRGRGKVILKKAFHDVLPPPVRRRSKAGFEIPISRWLRSELRFLLDRHLSRRRIVDQGIFDPQTVQGLIDAHLAKRADTSWMLWNLIVFQHWHRKHFG